MRGKKFSAEHCGITFIVTVAKHYSDCHNIMNEKRVYRFNGYTAPHKIWEKCAKNIIISQVKKDLFYLKGVEGFMGYNIVTIETV